MAVGLTDSRCVGWRRARRCRSQMIRLAPSVTSATPAKITVEYARTSSIARCQRVPARTPTPTMSPFQSAMPTKAAGSNGPRPQAHRPGQEREHRAQPREEAVGEQDRRAEALQPGLRTRRATAAEQEAQACLQERPAARPAQPVHRREAREAPRDRCGVDGEGRSPRQCLPGSRRR